MGCGMVVPTSFLCWSHDTVPSRQTAATAVDKKHFFIRQSFLEVILSTFTIQRKQAIGERFGKKDRIAAKI